MITHHRLDEALIAAGIPIVSTIIADSQRPNQTTIISFDPAATGEQRVAGNTIAANFDWSDAAERAYHEQQRVRSDEGLLLQAAITYLVKHIQRTVPNLPIPTAQEIQAGILAEVQPVSLPVKPALTRIPLRRGDTV